MRFSLKVRLKNADCVSVPEISVASKEPTFVRTGCAVRTKPRGIPDALLLMMSAFRIPGPHHSLAVVMPATIRGHAIVT